MSVSAGGLSLTDFTAYELPTKKWMKLICPKMRLRVLVHDRDFVSSTVKVDGRSPDGTNISSVHWPWNDDERPTFADNEAFEVKVERRFLLRYKCFRRTKLVAIGEVRTGGLTDSCTLPLYDGQYSTKELEHENRIKIGDITFKLNDNVETTSTLVETGGIRPTAGLTLRK